MKRGEIKALFDQQAPGYDRQWARMAPLRDCLHHLLDALLIDLPENARILSVGTGTGAEIAHLAARSPGWRFTAVDPSGAMLQLCRARAEAGGFASRCSFHEGYLETLPESEPHDAAICFLVSHFILDRGERAELFAAIAARLAPGAILVNADLSADVESNDYEALSRAWFSMMSQAEVRPEDIDKWRAAYRKDVALLPAAQVATIIGDSGFLPAVQFFQAGLICAWFARRRSS